LLYESTPMNSKIFYGLLTVIVIGFLGFAVANKKPEPPRPGSEQADNGRTHVQSKEYGGEEPPTSGDHTEPLAWQVYKQEVPDANVIHNMEHGGVYISYSPDLPKEDIEKIDALFSRPFSNPKFTPSKAVVAPRSANKAPIVMSSWIRSQTFETFDEQAIMDYYLRNTGKSPEPGAR
jgi:hypothetical protein